MHDRSFTVNLFQPSGATILTAQATGTIDPSALPSVSIASAMMLASDTVTTSLGFVISLSAPSPQTVTVAYATADGTATAGVDYVSSSGSVTFPSGAVSQTVMVQLKPASQFSLARTFTVSLSDASAPASAAARPPAQSSTRTHPPTSRLVTRR